MSPSSLDHTLSPTAHKILTTSGLKEEQPTPARLSPE